ncbi:MAG: DUF1016 N-terminal domain-containing protein, partial [Candidatus Delongbacteria bacterium]
MKNKKVITKKEKKFDFKSLVKNLENINREFAYQAKMAVNTSLTLRNWFIGAYIHEYELHGSDRAAYGDAIFDNLSIELQKKNISRSEARELRRYRQFYLLYPQIRDSATPKLMDGIKTYDLEKRESLTP